MSDRCLTNALAVGSEVAVRATRHSLIGLCRGQLVAEGSAEGRQGSRVCSEMLRQLLPNFSIDYVVRRSTSLRSSPESTGVPTTSSSPSLMSTKVSHTDNLTRCSESEASAAMSFMASQRARCFHRGAPGPSSSPGSPGGPNIDSHMGVVHRLPHFPASRRFASCTKVFLNFLEWPWRHVAIEVAGEWDLVADLGLVVVDPGVRDVGQDFTGEVLLDLLVTAVIGAMASSEDLSTQILNNPELSSKLLGELIPVVYDGLKPSA